MLRTQQWLVVLEWMEVQPTEAWVPKGHKQLSFIELTLKVYVGHPLRRPHMRST